MEAAVKSMDPNNPPARLKSQSGKQYISTSSATQMNHVGEGEKQAATWRIKKIREQSTKIIL